MGDGAACPEFNQARPEGEECACGKGHEREQTLATGTVPSDDAQIALGILVELGYGEEQ